MSKKILLIKLFILITLFLNISQNTTLAKARVNDKNIGWPGTDMQSNRCPNLGEVTMGPYDYNNPIWHSRQITQSNNALYLIESRHFTSNVRFLKGRNRGTGSMHSDLAYTLIRFPNHYRALYSISMYFIWKKYKEDFGPESNESKGIGLTPAECFFNRAIAFTKEDPKVYLLFGLYLRKLGKLDLALAELKKSETIDPENPHLIAELARLYFDKGDFQTSALYVEKAPKKIGKIKQLIKKLAKKNIIIKPTIQP